MKPVCVKCQCELRPKKNGAYVEEMADTEQPYRLWYADTWGCPSCGSEVVIGFARNPDAEHYEKDYQQRRKRAEVRYWPRPEMVPTGGAV